ncbi:T9SS type A sorting domain-containing protein [Segatella copri]|uniref:T9SS type A sorting domain-containing protein n=1 Tax=Segatella copri TaxID=165179 RepID=A0AAW4N8D5_9BACT|nr:T9SS type A sorting domain-containing protein [Segatella copri]MBV3388647.1 T9SS type A sorting domain-containing protein [Segatella copri]MBV3396454.1 T9SS type A sorting domain-containing protein [Segatella copri]MBV3406088.1 T9SS type A sorting domain-containing protein [Segatella copri]
MNKIKNIYRTLILLLSLVLMPVEGWAYVKGTTPLELQWSNYIKDKYNYACFYFEKDGTKFDISSWNILNDNNFKNSISSSDYDYSGHQKNENYVLFSKDKAQWGLWDNLFQYKIDPKSTDIHNSKLILLLSNDANLLTEKENLAGVTKMEFDIYTEEGLESSAVKPGNKSADFSKAESTSIISKAATSTNVTLPDFNAKYLRWQLFDSEAATTPVTSITNILSNSSSVEKGSDLIYYATDIADEAVRTMSFDFSKLAADANVENYVLKCTWANNDNGDAKVVTYNGTDYILQEPTLNGEYSFKFVKQETLDALPLKLSADNVAAASHNVDAIYKDNKLEVSLKDVVPEILSDFGVADKKDVSDFYMRWVLADKDGKIISANSNNSALALRKTSDGAGYYTLLSKEGSSLLPNGLNVTFELPSGFSWSSDMKVYCLLTNALTGYKEQYGVITKEPSAFKSKIKVKLYSPNDLPFKHYEGIANKKGDWDIVNGHTYQKTHEWEYYYYVDGTENQIFLSLPFEYGNDLEPRGYFRWYDYNTDQGSEHLKVCDETQTKLSKKGNRGLFANNIGANPTKDMIGVYYSTSHVNPSWEGETIACDVSRYVDGMDESRTYLLHEPTLSIRYIFHILPKKKIADDIMAALCNHDDGDYTYEDNKKVTFGYKDENSVATLRLQLQDISRYSFYPMTSDGLKKVVYNNDITEADFDKSRYVSVPQYGGSIQWRIYDVSKSKYCELSGDGRFLDLSEKKLNDAKWLNLEGSAVDASDKPVIDKGIPVFVVAYLKAGDNMCPVANFDVRFMNNHPMTKEEITKAGLNNRLISYLDEHYKMAAKPITFDDDDIEQTVAAPTNPDDNQDRLPSKWDRRAYSFVYRDLIDYDATNYGGSIKIGHSPLHGDYCLYKSANLSGVSTSSENYLWWWNKTLYDKTYEITNGSQYGHFLYVDASYESRKIAASDFTADLCTGQQLIFIASVADMTHQTIKPQIMFKLFGVNKDVNGEIVDKHLIHSFSSGDFSKNVNDLQQATWYQVYGKITLQKESNVEQYSDFRLEIDNYCKGTQGADYAVDDIRMYLAPAKVQVLQEKPICDNAKVGSVKLKIRAIHETLNAITGHKGQTKIYFRFVDEKGTPVEGNDESNPYYRTEQVNTSDGTKIEYKSNKYGTVDVFDSEETCNQYTIDGTPMIEKDSEGETYIVISNKDYPLTTGKKYYVSVSTEDPAKGNANWGTPAEVCSLYSNWFEMVSQHPIITDTKGNIVTDYKIPCDQADNYKVNIKGQLTTTDPHNGGKITLNNVKFFWYLDGKDEANKLDETASNEITISKDRLPLGKTHKIYMKPEGTEVDGYIPYKINGTTYLLCTGAIPVDLRVMKDGPQLNFGFNDVDYPFNDGDYEASLRIGLPQLEKLKASKGYLKVPLHSATMRDGTAINEPLTFIDDNGTSADASTKVYVASTNDPLWEKKLNTQVATLEKAELPAFGKTTQATLNLKFEEKAVADFHEGYYYVLRFAYEKRGATDPTTNCPGESYLKVKIVPEFITWTPTADGGMNANWNNDANWHRSSSTELHDNEYHDYQAYGNASGITAKVDIPTQNSYVPMKFTKVTIGNLKGLPFPDLGNIVYRSTNKIATQLTNGKGNEATKYIQYDIMAFWNEAAANKGLEAGNLKCEKFYGNTCHQIYFKPQGELRDQCYLIYDKAWVEKELVPNKWYTMASPLQYIYAGDMYVPASNGRQETKAFTDINFDTNTYSRSKYPIYQRAWMKSGVEEIAADGSKYPASHYPGVVAPGTVDMNLGYWSHVYNKVDESYAADGTFGGFSIKAGNALLPKDQTKKALLRLPKADTSYQYFDYNGTGNSSSETSVTKDPKGRGRLLVAFNNDEKHLAEKTQSLGTDNNSGFYLVANPYTCSISMAKFFEANTGLQKAIWMVENGEVKAISNAELDKQNYAIQPTQSFFVKKKEGEMVENVRFTSTMCIDRTITPGLRMASDYVKSIEATTENSSGQISKARIALRPEASADYDDQEDVDLLYDQNLKDIPQVYTVAGNEAVAVNAVPELSWIPLGIVSQQAEEVSLTLKGVSKLDAPVYLYDAASASFTELHEGEAVKVKAGDHGRYFLTQTRTSTGIDRMEAEDQSAPVKVYSPAAGMIVVSALGGEKLDRVQVFTLDGKMVHSYQLPDKQRMILRVPSGVYIVKASTQSCAQSKGQKIAVR